MSSLVLTGVWVLLFQLHLLFLNVRLRRWPTSFPRRSIVWWGGAVIGRRLCRHLTLGALSVGQRARPSAPFPQLGQVHPTAVTPAARIACTAPTKAIALNLSMALTCILLSRASFWIMSLAILWVCVFAGFPGQPGWGVGVLVLLLLLTDDLGSPQGDVFVCQRDADVSHSQLVAVQPIALQCTLCGAWWPTLAKDEEWVL